ncbi:MAG: hypothetical protein GY859_11500 [Desulfobacterales bacterium]|nr:hypothetical protein [Desulfobacterales bacterium]
MSPWGGLSETAVVSVNQALADHDRLVAPGDPGSGKTTLLRHLALLFARDMPEDSALVGETLGQGEPGRLPLWKIGAFLKNSGSHDDGTEGHGQLLEYAVDQTRRLLQAIRENERIRELAINPSCSP